MTSVDRRVPRINGLKLFEIAQRARDAAFSLIAGPGFASFGPGSRIMLPFRAGNPQKVAIGSQVLIGPSSWLKSVADLIGCWLLGGRLSRLLGSGPSRESYFNLRIFTPPSLASISPVGGERCGF